MPMPLTKRLVAHRGSPFRRPENTLDGIQVAVDSGATLFEVDIQLTSDFVPILYHDGDLQRISGRAANVCESTWEELHHLHASYPERFGDEFQEIPIYSLEQLIKRLGDWPTAQVFIELKVESLKHFGIAKVVEAVLPLLAAADPARIASVISKDDKAIEQIKKLTSLPIGWVLPAWNETNSARATELNLDFIFCNQTRLPASNDDLWKGDWKWAIYTVNDVKKAEQLFDRGFDFVETDKIDEMISHFSDQSHEN